MADLDEMTPGEILAEASVADFIKALGLSIAEAQTALDENSVNQIAHFVEPRPALDGRSLLDLGLSPAFYHYQHADVAVALQLSLKVEESTGVDLNLSGNFGDGSTSNNNSHESESETSSGSSTSTTHREARVEIAMSTQGALTVGGNRFELSGADPQARIESLAERLRSDSGGDVARALPTHECGPVNPAITPSHSRIVTTPNSVAFLGAGLYSRAIIRISEVPASAETFTLKSGTSVDVPPAADVRAYTDAVAAAITGLGYGTIVAAGPDGYLLRLTHEFDQPRYNQNPSYEPSQDETVQTLAAFLIDTGMNVNIEGFTDRSGPADYNLRLGQARGTYVRDRLLQLGVPSGQLNLIQSRGEQEWADAGAPDGTPNEAHRLVRISMADRSDYLIFVGGNASHEIVRAEVRPDRFSEPLGTTNGFIYVYKPQTGDLTGSSRRVDVGGQRFPLRGDASGSFGQHAAESYAANLAADINANDTAEVHAWAEGNVVHLCPEGSRWSLTLLTTQSREISMSGTEDVTVTQAFSRSRSRDVTTQSTGNRTVAVGASLGVRHSRQFETNVTGNSSISARIVAVPAPPEFLATIKDYLS